MPHSDPATRKEYGRKYYQENKEYLRQKTKEWASKNLEKIRIYGKKSYHKTVKGSPEAKVLLLLRKAKARAKKKGIEFSITINDLIIPTHCPLNETEICYDSDSVKPNSPSIDRIDSTNGYVPGNVWIISHKANTVKSDLDIDALKRIVNNLEKAIKNKGID